MPNRKFDFLMISAKIHFLRLFSEFERTSPPIWGGVGESRGRDIQYLTEVAGHLHRDGVEEKWWTQPGDPSLPPHSTPKHGSDYFPIHFLLSRAMKTTRGLMVACKSQSTV